MLYIFNDAIADRMNRFCGSKSLWVLHAGIRILVVRGGGRVWKIDRYGYFEAGTDISAIHGPIADISTIFKPFFLLHY